VDAVAPVIHEFTYEPMVHDLLPMDGNLFRYQVRCGLALAPGAGAWRWLGAGAGWVLAPGPGAGAEALQAL
jgi:hypothetical protein